MRLGIICPRHDGNNLGQPFTRPVNPHLPTHRPELPRYGAIPRDVLCNLTLPELDVRSRKLAPATALVSVPKTSVNKHGDLGLRQNDIGSAGEARALTAVSNALCAQPPLESLLRCGMFVSNQRHNGGTFFLRENIRHLCRQATTVSVYIETLAESKVAATASPMRRPRSGGTALPI